MELPVRLTVPTRLSVGVAGTERLITETGQFTEVDLPVRVAANIAWTLRIALPEEHEEQTVLARDAAGAWRPLTSQPLAVRGADDATDHTEVLVRLRLPAGTPSAGSLGLRLSLTPAIGAP